MTSVRKAPLVLPGVTGTARTGETGEVVARLAPGDIAVIDHSDLGRDDAAVLVETGVRLVVNAAPFVSAKSTGLGAELLAEAGVLLVDDVGTDVFERIADGQRVRVVEGSVYDAPGEGEVADDGELLARGRKVDPAQFIAERVAARAQVATRLSLVATATSELLRREPELLVHGLGLPELATRLAGRPVVVVARVDHTDLRALRTFFREQSPALVATGEAAEELLAEGWAPDVVVVRDADPTGDVRQVVRDVVRVVRPDAELSDEERDGAHVVTTTLEAADVALLLAADGAELVVGVGLPARLEELAEPGAAGAFATRLRLGPRIIDAHALQLVYATRPRLLHVALVALAGLAALGAAVSVTEVGHGWLEALGDALGGLL